jgi:hypothetical protein
MPQQMTGPQSGSEYHRLDNRSDDLKSTDTVVNQPNDTDQDKFTRDVVDGNEKILIQTEVVYSTLVDMWTKTTLHCMMFYCSVLLE